MKRMITGGTIEQPITDRPHRMSRLADALLHVLPIDSILEQARRPKPPYRRLRRKVVTVVHELEGGQLAVDHSLRFFDV